MQTVNERYDYIDNYNQIANEFLNNYYNAKNSNIVNTYMFYNTDCLFTFLGNELKGFNNYIQKIRNLSLLNIKFIVDNVKIQPSINKTLIVTVKGKFHNNSKNYNYYNFIEIILLKKNMFDRFVIYNNLFIKV